MDNLKLLDVSFRDGGYKTNFCFSPELMEYILTKLDEAKIDYVEVGYKNGSFKPISNIGISGICSRSYLEWCKKYLAYSKLTVMFHPKNITKDDLEEMQDSGVDCVRICFPAQNSRLGFESINLAKKYGFQVFVNITRITEYLPEKLFQLIKELSQYEIEAIYLADSNGSMIPQKINDLFSCLSKEKYSVKFGFHAHDNLFLAQSNAIAAITNGVQYIDTSLCGIGKGSGNLKTEGFITFLNACGNTQYNLSKLLEAADRMSSTLKNFSISYPKDIILGVFNLSQDDAEKLDEFLNISDYYARAKEYFQNVKSLAKTQMEFTL
jgi:4-hydroxy 2-oxovalerate aldolase